ncbi:MAG: TonB-dependent receptor [Spirochaetes bacterium]|nr:TonB-dependent receptor [Spirochaetota bacterium]
MNVFIKLCIFLFAILLLFSFQNLSAQEEPAAEEKTAEVVSESDAADLGKVVVTATKTAQNVKDLPVHAEIITAEDIKEAKAESVAQLINNRISGHVHQYNMPLQLVNMRGYLGGTHGYNFDSSVLILVDGHKMAGAGLGTISLEMIERIEIINGPASALYGSNALGGVINIITRKPKGPVKSLLGATYGSFNYAEGYYNIGGIVNDFFGFNVSTSYTKRGEFETVDYGTAYNHKYEMFKSQGNFIFTINENNNLRLGYTYDKVEYTTGKWLNSEKFTEYDSDVTSESFKDRAHMDAEYNMDLFKKKIHWMAIGFFDWQESDTYNGNPITTSTQYITDLYSYGTDQQLTFKLPFNNEVVFGYTYEVDEKKNKKIAISGGEMKHVNYTPNLQQINHSLYAQDKIDLLENRLNIIAGIRYDYFEDVTKKQSDWGEVEDYPEEFEENAKSFDNISPRVGASFKISQRLKVRTSVGQGFKAPAPDQLSAYYLVNSSDPNYYLIGNSDLKPEVSTTYEGGFDFDMPALSFGSTFFYTKSKDRLPTSAEENKEGITIDGLNVRTYYNIDEATISGTEAYITIPLGQLFKLPLLLDLSSKGQYYFKYEDEATGENLRDVNVYDIKSQLRAAYNVVSVTLAHVYIGESTYKNFDKTGNPIEEKAPFQYFDLTFAYQALEWLSVNGGIFNVLNEQYEFVYGYPMPERNYKIGVEMAF